MPSDALPASRYPTPDAKPRFWVTPEHLLVLCGLVLATAAGLFAAHSISVNTGYPRHFTAILPAGELMAWKRGIAGASVAQRDIDPLTTGSIPAVTGVAGDDRGGRDGAAAAREPRVIAGYVLAEVVNGVAVIESADGIRQVRPGSVVPGAGRVSAVERQESGWVVVTSQGVIREAR